MDKWGKWINEKRGKWASRQVGKCVNMLCKRLNIVEALGRPRLVNFKIIQVLLKFVPAGNWYDFD